jgi:ribulose-phosphate 3-epimerase
MTRLSAGVLTADLTRLRAELSILDGTGAWAHVDVMDGVFCPQLTAGAPLVRAVAACGSTVDAHLLVDEPRRYLAEMVDAGATVLTVHAEATRHLHQTMRELTELQAANAHLVRGLALNPGTPVAALEPVIELVDHVLVLAVNPGWRGQRPAANTARRVAAVRALAEKYRVPLTVGVDGGVTLGNAAEVASWGADVVVSGSAVYDGIDPPGNLARIVQSLSPTPGGQR